MPQLKIAFCDDDAENIYNWFHDNKGEKETFMSLHFPEYDRITTSKLFGSFSAVVECINQGQFNEDLLITDINFGGDTVPNDRMYEGLQILELVHQNYPKLDKILVTGYASQYTFDDVIKAHRNEMVDWLKKGKTGGQLYECPACETQRSLVGETFCRKCGAPLENFRYELYKCLKPIFRSLKQRKDDDEQLQKAREGASPPELYEVTIIKKDPFQGPIVASIQKKESPARQIVLELKPRIQGLVFLCLAESKDKKFLSPSDIAKRVNELRGQEEPTPIDNATRDKFIKPDKAPLCAFEINKIRRCSRISCGALQISDICPFDFLFYARYNTKPFNAPNVRTHIKEIRKSIFELDQMQAGEKRLKRCIYFGSEESCDLLSSSWNSCEICRNQLIMHTERGYGLAAKVIVK